MGSTALPDRLEPCIIVGEGGNAKIPGPMKLSRWWMEG